MPLPRCPQKGFTLIELVIAMTLMSLILTILFGGLRLAGRSWDAGTARADKSNEMRLVETLVTRTVRQLYPIVWQDATGSRLSFAGGANAVMFTAPLPARSGIAGIYLISLELKRDGKRQELLMRRQIYRPDMRELSEKAETTVLLEDITHAGFSYFGSQGPQDAPQWTESWEGASAMALPQLIRLSLATDQPWPDIVAPVMNDSFENIPVFGNQRQTRPIGRPR